MRNKNKIINEIIKNENVLGEHGVCSLAMFFDPMEVRKIHIELFGPKDSGAIINCILNFVIDTLNRSDYTDEERESIADYIASACVTSISDPNLTFDAAPIECEHTGEILDTQLGNIIFQSIGNSMQELSATGVQSCTMFHYNESRTDYMYAGDLKNLLMLLGTAIPELFKSLNISETNCNKFCSGIFENIVQDLPSFQEKCRQYKAETVS